MGDRVVLAGTGPVRRLRLNRPDKRNALDGAMWRDLDAALAVLEADRDALVTLVSGVDGACFCAGSDIDEMSAAAGDPAAVAAVSAEIAAVENRLERLELPTLALINGPCMGAGCSLALCCDLRFATPDARFAIPPAKLGFVYPIEDVRRLVDAVGVGLARDLLYSGRVVDAVEALAIGLVQRVAPAETLEAEALAWAETVAANSQFSVRASKRLIAMIAAGRRAEDAETRAMFEAAFTGVDFAEGVAAFQQKRRPIFTHR